MIARFVQEGKSIDYTPGADVAAGDVVVLTNIIGIAKLDIAANALGALTVIGGFEVAKPSDEAWVFGQRLFWDADNEQFTTTNTGIPAGCAGADAAETATLGNLLLNVAPLVPVEATSVDLTDNSGGVDPGDDIIAAITSANNAGSADVLPTAAAIKQLATQYKALRADLVSAGVLIA